MQNHVLELTNLIKKLSSLSIVMDEFFLVSYNFFLVSYNLASLPSEYGTFQISYNTSWEKWSLEELSRIRCLKAKEPMKAILGPKKDLGKDKCHFCNKHGHYQKDCPKRKAWFEKNGIPYNPETSTM
ncbi:hypothetical protein ACJIZ3_005999 [Penstemon smallii]|uniref:CCHC-type domain-containing protein n=1 Tax=Penstemon smallii TaxID=265156 RepID=A0ABD3S6L8_9LAMI